jgi:putative ABC transport system permease protein
VPSTYSPVTLHIVGIATTPVGLLRGGDTTETFFFASPAFARRFASSSVGPSIYVQLHHPGDLDAFERAVPRATPGTTFQLKPARQELTTFARVASPYTNTLWLFALVAAVATMLIVAQALVRMVRIDATAGSDLRALGTTSTQRAAVAAVRAMIAVVLGACVTVAVAIAASPLFPLGLVHRVEPDPGVRVDGPVLVLGALVIVVVLGGVALVVARWATRASSARPATGPGSRSFVASTLERVNLPLSIAGGARFAFSRGRNNAGVSATASIVGLVAAIAATSAALVFGANLDQLTTPSRYGQTWDAEIVSGGTSTLSPGEVEHRLASRSLAAGTSIGTFGDVTLEGHDVPASGVEPRHGRGVLVAAKGRLPVGPGEIALGARTLRQLHRSVGDRVTASASDGRREQLQIVGQVLLPSLNSNAPTLGADDGALLTRPGLVRLNPDLGDEVDFVLLHLAPHKTLTQLRRSFASNDFTVTGAAPPSDIASYNNVESTPLVLAGLLTILGIGVLAHLLVTSVRRSRRDLAIFKTLGCTRRQLMLMVVSQALMLVFTALVAGLTIGLVAGRDVWIRFAEGLGLVPTVDLPSLRIVAVVVAGLAFAVVIAWIPARAATRVAPARVLRTE